jgi:pimeloyl-ACP methyl ester carboxylesterase
MGAVGWEVSMATFVLVHGGWHGGWCWERLSSYLRAAGHATATPTLTGLAERAHLLSPAVGLDTHIRDIVNVLADDDLRDVRLVGHSYAGMVISGVAEEVPERLVHLVYLDAFVPADGQALFDILLPARRALYQEQARVHGDGWRVPPPPAHALGVTVEADAAWLAARLTPHPLRAFEQPVRLANPRAAALPRTFIWCTEGVTTPSFAGFAERARVGAGWRCRELAAGHDAMVTVPQALAELLLELA